MAVDSPVVDSTAEGEGMAVRVMPQDQVLETLAASIYRDVGYM